MGTEPQWGEPERGASVANALNQTLITSGAATLTDNYLPTLNRLLYGSSVNSYGQWQVPR